MATFVPDSGTWEFVRIPTKANTVYTYGAAYYNDGTDNVDAVTTTEEINGIIMEAKASAANTNPITVAIPRSPQCTFRGTVGTGTLTAAYIGRLVDLASSTTVDITASTEDALEVVGFISATEGIFKINYSKGKE